MKMSSPPRSSYIYTCLPCARPKRAGDKSHTGWTLSWEHYGKRAGRPF